MGRDGRRLDTLKEAKRSELRRTAFGFVFQFGQLVPELSTADNLALPLLLHHVNRKQAYSRAASWLDRLGLEDLGGRRTGPDHQGVVGQVECGAAEQVGAEDADGGRGRPR